MDLFGKPGYWRNMVLIEMGYTPFTAGWIVHHVNVWIQGEFIHQKGWIIYSWRQLPTIPESSPKISNSNIIILEIKLLGEVGSYIIYSSILWQLVHLHIQSIWDEDD